MVEAAAEHLSSREVDVLVLVSVDSYYDWGVLEHLRRRDRLLTPDNLDGLRPGEAAACLVLTSPTHPLAHGAGVSQLVATGGGREPSRPGEDAPPNMAQGFSAALRDAVGPLRERKVRADTWYSDLSHEAFRVREFQILMGRFGDVASAKMKLELPARALGDVGAASLVLYACLATEAWYRGYANGPNALCFAAPDDMHRGALHIRSIRR
jgi:3-oxoacyl-[acyl-carrier-protein] synthase-1